MYDSKSISNYIIAGSIYNKGSNICIYALTVENSQDLLLEDEFFKPSARKWVCREKSFPTDHSHDI
ncbi:hypothetical protein T05_14613 [Trichinella murrelli]|uniref:Uncharacterized protein n=1 Tax=Trichinella murrelli TaxID=144512 RepID=A0A0V0TBU0_9BILA|nr:hypothetical protein T05_14613 [Trichinella murrelli]